MSILEEIDLMLNESGDRILEPPTYKITSISSDRLEYDFIDKDGDVYYFYCTLDNKENSLRFDFDEKNNKGKLTNKHKQYEIFSYVLWLSKKYLKEDIYKHLSLFKRKYGDQFVLDKILLYAKREDEKDERRLSIYKKMMEMHIDEFTKMQSIKELPPKPDIIGIQVNIEPLTFDVGSIETSDKKLKKPLEIQIIDIGRNSNELDKKDILKTLNDYYNMETIFKTFSIEENEFLEDFINNIKRDNLFIEYVIIDETVEGDSFPIALVIYSDDDTIYYTFKNEYSKEDKEKLFSVIPSDASLIKANSEEDKEMLKKVFPYIKSELG